MNDFLGELKALLDKHNAIIVHSTGSDHELVVCIGRQEAWFEEEIGEVQIRNRWWADKVGAP
jgi:hypothetical protein